MVVYVIVALAALLAGAFLGAFLQAWAAEDAALERRAAAAEKVLAARYEARHAARVPRQRDTGEWLALATGMCEPVKVGEED